MFLILTLISLIFNWGWQWTLTFLVIWALAEA